MLQPAGTTESHELQPGLQPAQFSGAFWQLPLMQPVAHWPCCAAQPVSPTNKATAISIKKACFISDESFLRVKGPSFEKHRPDNPQSPGNRQDHCFRHDAYDRSEKMS